MLKNVYTITRVASKIFRRKAAARDPPSLASSCNKFAFKPQQLGYCPFSNRLKRPTKEPDQELIHMADSPSLSLRKLLIKTVWKASKVARYEIWRTEKNSKEKELSIKLLAFELKFSQLLDSFHRRRRAHTGAASVVFKLRYGAVYCAHLPQLLND